MNFLKHFIDFIKESYLKSGKAPVYHITDAYYLPDILNSNTLKKGSFDNPINNDILHFVSLTRNKDLDMSYYKSTYTNVVVLELDKNELSKNYRIIPYDFFMHSGKETHPKSSLKRKEKFEFEEVVLEDIVNLDKYLVGVIFRTKDISDVDPYKLALSRYVKKLKVSYDGTTEYSY